MSQRWEQIGEYIPENFHGVSDRVVKFYHIPFLLTLLGFILWNRLRNWERFVQNGQVLFNGNDAWYHFRQVQYTVANWPFTMPYDPWTGFPIGHTSGQFGTIYDQLIATVALIIGLGNPSEQTIALTLLFTPAVFGALTAIPVYVMGERLSGRPGGLIAVLVLALTPGAFLQRTLVGFADHHVAEVFFLSVGVALVMMAVSVAERERPIYELITARDWDALARPARWGAIAGLGATLYIWAWPPGVLLLAVLGAFLAIKLAIDFSRGASPDHVALVGAFAMGVTALLTLLTIDSFDIQTTTLSLLQPGFALAVALGALFMAWLARVWDARSLPRWGYPVAIVAVGGFILAVFAVALPDLFDYFVGQALRVIGYDATAQSRTVGEAQPIPLDQAVSVLYQSYGLALFVAAAAVAFAVWKLYTEAENGELLLIVVLGLFMTAATLTQQRFSYYLVIPLAVLNGYLLGQALTWVELDAIEDLRSIQAYQVLAVLTVILVVVGPFVAFPAAAQGGGGLGSTLGSATLTPVQVSDGNFPGEVTEWEGSLQWLANETPTEGQYANPNGEPMAYYGQFQRTDDYEYPEGAYGVMAWWDYGHFITVEGERIPYANPFQQHATGAAVYLLEPDEETANEMLVSADGEETRYVMLDWKLDYAQSGKFSAPLVFYDTSNYDTDAGPSLSRSDIHRFVLDQQTQRVAFTLNRQRHYESMRTRLYKFHGSAISPSAPNGVTYVVDYEPTQSSLVVFTPSGTQTLRSFRSVSAARHFVEEDGSAQIGGFGGFSSEPVPALEHYRLVDASDSNAIRSRRFQQLLIRDMQGLGLCQQANQCLSIGLRLQPTPPRWVKTFERVPGAEVVGQGPANETVTASATFEMPGSNETFTYRQRAQTDESGQFTMTLPYSTTGYESWGPAQGHTNVSVRATGPYTFSTVTVENLTTSQWQASAHVSEGQVIGEDDTTVRVTLEEEVLDRPEGAPDSGDGNTTDGGSTDGGSGENGTSTNETNTSSARMAGPRASG